MRGEQAWKATLEQLGLTRIAEVTGYDVTSIGLWERWGVPVRAAVRLERHGGPPAETWHPNRPRDLAFERARLAANPMSDPAPDAVQRAVSFVAARFAAELVREKFGDFEIIGGGRNPKEQSTQQRQRRPIAIYLAVAVADAKRDAVAAFFGLRRQAVAQALRDVEDRRDDADFDQWLEAAGERLKHRLVGYLA